MTRATGTPVGAIVARSGNFISGRDKRADELKTALGAIRRDLDKATGRQVLTFGGSYSGQTSYLIPNYTGRRQVTRVVGGMAALPSIIGNWTVPNSTNDFWTSTAAGHSFYHPLDLEVGDTITRLQLWFYRGGANNPTISLRTAAAGASSTTLTPTVAWTSPSASTTWELLEASYDEPVSTTGANFHLRTQADNIGDRIRSLSVTVTTSDQTPTTEPLILLPFPCRVTRLQVYSPTAGTGSGSMNYTVRRNGTDTSLALSVPATGREGFSAGKVDMEAGDRLSIKAATSGVVSTYPTPIFVSLEVIA